MENQFTTGAEVRAALKKTCNTEVGSEMSNFFRWVYYTHWQGKQKHAKKEVYWIRERVLESSDEELIFAWAVFCMSGGLSE